MIPFTCQILPDTDLFDGQKLIPLSDPQFRRTVVASLQEWVELTQPNVLKEHERDGGTYGRILDLYEGAGGIYVDGIITEPEAAQDMSQGKFRFVSPTVAWSFKADDGKTYPAALLEVSLVSVPRHFTRQPDIQVHDHARSSLSQLNPSHDCYFMSDAAMVSAALSSALDKLNK